VRSVGYNFGRSTLALLMDGHVREVEERRMFYEGRQIEYD